MFWIFKQFRLEAGLSEPKAVADPGFLRQVGVVCRGGGGGDVQSSSTYKPQPEGSRSERTTTRSKKFLSVIIQSLQYWQKASRSEEQNKLSGRSYF